MSLIKSHVSREQSCELFQSCQAGGGGCEMRVVVVILLPGPEHPVANTRSRGPPRSQVCRQPSLLDMLCSLPPWQDSQFSPFIYTPSPRLHVTWELCGRTVAADPGAEAVSTDPSLPCWGPDLGHVILRVTAAAFHATKHISKIINLFYFMLFITVKGYFSCFSLNICIFFSPVLVQTTNLLKLIYLNDLK